MKKIYIVLAFFFIIIGCTEKNTQKGNSNLTYFEKNLNFSINDFMDSVHCSGKLNRIIQIRHQQYKNKDYIQIASVYDYSTDSLFYFSEYRSEPVVYYNENYFKEKIEYKQYQKDSLLQKYERYNDKYSDGMISEKRCFEIFQIEKDKFLRLSHSSFEYNNLFAAPPVSPPPPLIDD